ncbi:MAG: type V CRISPR-associated protein Cas4 [Candidatus Sungbacteria bacterium RIFCSPLOWO2_01_FULL_54_21]|uniref:Type V CRISPR-associated protein Cas4 n=1 Tax=Candidatus Sungbacteria bacterium RIFCSPLOWO2_01_FULL_54_21 TaxID=1802279 RepID=A0A1G2L5S1_9BACT|nr:MAG: type V CRISPR-associated protein Cas4 [Candidatus Sungbacteria bacterium RIFCSPLOWO2_01_FULL_54_21]
MESYIQISKINDFMFCPLSLYLHSVYESFDTSLYHEAAQIEGRANHEGIEQGTYSTSKHILQGLSVYSERFGIMGRIDIYDEKKKLLVERKTRIKTLWPGYVYQVYGQYFAMREMGYRIEQIALHSLKNNKRYFLPIPTERDEKRFGFFIDQMRAFDIRRYKNHRCHKCMRSIYGLLTW